MTVAIEDVRQLPGGVASRCPTTPGVTRDAANREVLSPARDAPTPVRAHDRDCSLSVSSAILQAGTANSGQSVHVAALVRVAWIGGAMLLLSWVLMAFAARRLPPGAARDLAAVLPACLTTTRRLRADPRVPRRAKVAVAFAGLWVLSPIDLIPEFLPIIGPLDDVIVVALAFRYAARQVPREVLLEAWPAEERILARLLG